RVPFGFAAIKSAIESGGAQGHQIRLQAHHDRLGFRVAETAVVFDHLGGAAGVDHQSRVEETDVGIAFLCHAANGRHNHFVHYALVNRVGHHGGWRVGAHAASVGASIAIAYAFMVLTGRHRQNAFAVGDYDKTGFFTAEKLFDNHTATRVAEGIAGQ